MGRFHRLGKCAAGAGGFRVRTEQAVWFKAISGDNVIYDVVDSYTALMEKVMKQTSFPSIFVMVLFPAVLALLKSLDR